MFLDQNAHCCCWKLRQRRHCCCLHGKAHVNVLSAQLSPVFLMSLETVETMVRPFAVPYMVDTLQICACQLSTVQPVNKWQYYQDSLLLLLLAAAPPPLLLLSAQQPA